LKRKLATGVYWGRFNPPHKGHLRVIRRLNREWDLIVAIGSSEYRDEKKNPFSGAERKRMLEAYLKESKIRGVRVVTLNDGRSVSWAIDNLIRKCRPDALFLSTERSELARRARRKVAVLLFPRTGGVSSTKIRDSIASTTGTWRKLTGKSVAKIIVELDGIRRIQVAYGKDR
jgi:nicotinamide-nucleotide adenylyltransferase